MQAAALTVLLVLASGDPGDGSTGALTRALRGALEHEPQVITYVPAASMTEGEVVAVARAEHAPLVVVVRWEDHQRRVILRLGDLARDVWTEREVRFDAADAPVERGRTAGFALASLVPESMPESPREAPARAPSIPPAETATAAPVAPIRREAGPSPALPRPNPLAIDAHALVVAAPSGYGGGVGGGLAVRVPVAGALGVRAGASARAESVGPAQASAKVVDVAAGITFQPWLDAQRRWALGGRASALLGYLDVEHFSSDQERGAHLSRFQPGVEAAVEGTYRFAEQAGFIGSAGTEVVFGKTDVYVGERRVTTIVPFKLVAEAGLRVSFP
ncbi:MAG: hypothetical protein JWP97_3656 [Labilithrix sp.]|nr:hypothetical protein [Labilithrix sp.]